MIRNRISLFRNTFEEDGTLPRALLASKKPPIVAPRSVPLDCGRPKWLPLKSRRITSRLGMVAKSWGETDLLNMPPVSKSRKLALIRKLWEEQRLLVV